MWNSFVIYKKSGGNLKQVEFRMKLIEKLIEESGPNAVVRCNKTPE